MKTFTKLLYHIFHPILIPVLTCFLFFSLTKNYYYRYEILITISQVVILTFLIPITIYHLLKSLQLLKSSIFIKDIKERIIPIILYIILLIVLKDFVLKQSTSYEYKIYIWGTIYTYILLLLGISLKKKLSIHTASISGCITFFILLCIRYHTPNILIINILICILGLTAFSRLYLKTSTSADIIYGFIVGTIPQILFWQLSYYNI